MWFILAVRRINHGAFRLAATMLLAQLALVSCDLASAGRRSSTTLPEGSYFARNIRPDGSSASGVATFRMTGNGSVLVIEFENGIPGGFCLTLNRRDGRVEQGFYAATEEQTAGAFTGTFTVGSCNPQPAVTPIRHQIIDGEVNISVSSQYILRGSLEVVGRALNGSQVGSRQTISAIFEAVCHDSGNVMCNPGTGGVGPS